MNKIKLMLTMVLTLGLFGCSSVQVSQDYVDSVAFSQLRTYSWHPQPVQYSDDVRARNPLLHRRFAETISAVLAQKGYSQVQSADFLVTYNYSVTQKLESYPGTAFFGYGYGPHRRYGGYGGIGYGVGTDIRQYDVGILVIDIYDATTNSVIWRGKGSEIVTSHPSPQQTTELVNRLVREVLVQFPPG